MFNFSFYRGIYLFVVMVVNFLDGTSRAVDSIRFDSIRFDSMCGAFRHTSYSVPIRTSRGYVATNAIFVPSNRPSFVFS